MENKSNLTVS